MFSFSNPTETLKFQIPHIASVWGQEQAASSYIGQKFLPPNMASVEAIEQKGANTPRSPLLRFHFVGQHSIELLIIFLIIMIIFLTRYIFNTDLENYALCTLLGFEHFQFQR